MSIKVSQLITYMQSQLANKGDYDMYIGSITIGKENISIDDIPLISVSIDNKNKVFRIFDARTTDAELELYNKVDLNN